jgi:hypothetical protein
MLTVNMREKATGRIELKNMTLKTGQSLLYYLYNNQLPETADLKDLLPVADQYELPALKAICVDGLVDNVTKDNYLELMHLAELYGLKPLKAKVIEYIAANADRLAK